MPKSARYKGPHVRPAVMPADGVEGTTPTDAGAIDRGALYTAGELEFMKAVERFQKETGRKFLSHVDYLRVLLAIGYTRANTTE